METFDFKENLVELLRRLIAILLTPLVYFENWYRKTRLAKHTIDTVWKFPRYCSSNLSTREEIAWLQLK